MPPNETESTKQVLPPFWRRLLAVVAVGKAAVGGAGLALAVAGAFNIAAAVTAQHWVKDFEKNYLDWVAATGGLSGAAVATVRIFSKVVA